MWSVEALNYTSEASIDQIMLPRFLSVSGNCGVPDGKEEAFGQPKQDCVAMVWEISLSSWSKAQGELVQNEGFLNICTMVGFDYFGILYFVILLFIICSGF